MDRRLAVLTLLGALASGACAGDTITKGRQDSGVAPGDGGTSSPLLLMTGMTFTYSAVLKYRQAQLDAEDDSQWTMRLEITQTNDQGSRGESTIDFMASSVMMTNDQSWTQTDDFDSWVARLGPALASDVVDTTKASTAHLSQVPQIPPKPTPKVLPATGTFFVDFRQIDALKTGFAAMYASEQPMVVDATMNAGKWQFSLMGNDPTIFYYPDRLKIRAVTLEYDPRGFLTHIEETIGDTSMRPNLVARIDLTSGP